MSFNSLQFILFFIAISFLYFSLPFRFRWVLLLAGSYYFYMCWKAEYILLIVASTLLDYFCGIQMGKTPDKSRRIKYLYLSLFGNLLLLGGFKYFNFFNDSLRAVFEHFNLAYHIPYFHVLLPVGISFYTFQTLSYTLDVYRGEKEPEKHFGIFALYVSFFPQLVAGPIERSTHLLPQFFKKNSFDFSRAEEGIALILWGLFKKVVIADRLSIYVDAVYSNFPHHGGLTLLTATFFFTIQVYCDFSAYSDIAKGSARVLGFDLMENFRRPFFSKSIAELWQRWHISLMSWFKDYLYIPLGGSRVSKWRQHFNILFIFFVSGLWHGANWTFVLFGVLHGVFSIASKLFKSSREKLCKLFYLQRFPSFHNFLRILFTFSLFCLSLVVFRSPSLRAALEIYKKIFVLSQPLFFGQFSSFFYSLLGIVILFFVETRLELFPKAVPFLKTRHLFLRDIFYAVLVITIFLIGVFDGGQFIYFQF